MSFLCQDGKEYLELINWSRKAPFILQSYQMLLIDNFVNLYIYCYIIQKKIGSIGPKCSDSDLWKERHIKHSNRKN